jgi:hypothetical protein
MSYVAPELSYVVRTFHPGYFAGPEPDTVPKGGTPDARNCLFAGEQLDPAPRARLDKRTGCRMLTAAAVVAGKGFDALYEFRKVGQTSGRLVAVIDGKVWYWDNVSTFVQIGATQPFTPGVKVQASTIRNLLFLMDGAHTRCWDGVLANDLFTPGELAPTGAPTLTVTAGPGVTGTYEGFAVWYDSTHDHETSPSPLTAQVAFVNQSRTWAKPAGAPAANYDKWRVYARRVDTNEVYYWRVVDVAIATVSSAETTTDAARRLGTVGPLPLSNDPPPTDFVFQTEYQGYRLGVRANDDQVYVAKLGDPQSQHPTDILGVSRGSGGELRSIYKFGTECVAQKVSKTYRLKGDRMPFLPDEVHSTFGNVGPLSAVEIKGQFYAWDEDKGPYWTDLNLNWVPIATATIQDVVASVPKTSAQTIECVHIKSKNLVAWAVPTGASARRRTIIAFHTEFRTWLPPITGLEYASLATFIDTNGSLDLYVGDYWGRLYKYFTDTAEGVPSGSLVARVVSSTNGTVTCDYELTLGSTGVWSVPGAPSAVAFYTGGSGLAGLPVLHINSAGARQWRRIQSNTGSVITLDTTNDAPWTTLPQAGEQIVVGAIDWYWRSPVVDFGDPFTKKKLGWLETQVRVGSVAFQLQIVGLQDGLRTQAFKRGFSFNNSSTWGNALWGAMVWGGGDPGAVKMRLERACYSFALEFANPYPNQPAGLLGFQLGADRLGRRKAASGGS